MTEKFKIDTALADLNVAQIILAKTTADPDKIAKLQERQAEIIAIYLFHTEPRLGCGEVRGKFPLAIMSEYLTGRPFFEKFCGNLDPVQLAELKTRLEEAREIAKLQSNDIPPKLDNLPFEMHKHGLVSLEAVNALKVARASAKMQRLCAGEENPLSEKIETHLSEGKLHDRDFIQRGFGAERIPEYLLIACARDMAELLFATNKIIRNKLAEPTPTEKEAKKEHEKAAEKFIKDEKVRGQAEVSAELLSLIGYKLSAITINQDENHHLKKSLVKQIRELGEIEEDSQLTVRDVLSTSEVGKALRKLHQGAKAAIDTILDDGPERSNVLGILGEKLKTAEKANHLLTMHPSVSALIKRSSQAIRRTVE